MKIKRFIPLIFLAACLGLFGGARHAYAVWVVGDGGGGGGPNQYLSTQGPAPNSIKFNPPNTAQDKCNGIADNYPCSDTLHGNESPYYVVGNNAVIDSSGHKTYPHTSSSVKIYLKSGNQPITITVWNEASNCHNSGILAPDTTNSKGQTVKAQAPDYD